MLSGAVCSAVYSWNAFTLFTANDNQFDFQSSFIQPRDFTYGSVGSPSLEGV